MAKTVSEGFQTLLSWIEPLDSEVAGRTTHKTTIEQAIRTEFAGFNRIEMMGSHTRRTAIRKHSDVDYLAVLGKADVTWGDKWVQSSTTLTRLRDALRRRFPQTDSRVDGQAIVVHFQGGNGSVDVVPGIWTSTTPIDGYPVFHIPDGNGWWMPTSPQRHGKYIKEEDARCGSKLSATVRLLKAWKYARTPSIPLLGFHLELLLAQADVCVGPKGYAQCLYEAFQLIRSRNGQALRDPLGISSLIPAAQTERQAGELVQQAATAEDRAARALAAESQGSTDEAFRLWAMVFNNEFPAR